MNGFSVMNIFQAIIGAYLIYAAITGRGKLYSNENIMKDKKEEYHKMIRIFLFIVGPLCLLEVLFDYLKLNTLSYIMFALLIAGIVLITIRIMRITNHGKGLP